MQFTSIIALGVPLLTSFVRTATIEDVAASNLALAQQCINADEVVVAITAATPPTTAQEVPTALQSMTNAVASAQAAAADTAATSDTVTEFLLARSWGEFTNQVEELMADYVEQKSNLAGIFGLQEAIFEQCEAFNTAFQDYATFTLGLVPLDDPYWWEIFYNTANATGNPPHSGIVVTLNAYNTTGT